MARYIDAEQAKTFFEEIDAGSRTHTTLLTPYEFAEYLDEIPTANVVEVVRCKDCKYFNGKIDVLCERCGDIDEPCGGCHYTGGCTYDDGYCHHGERRKEDAEIH